MSKDVKGFFNEQIIYVVLKFQDDVNCRPKAVCELIPRSKATRDLMRKLILIRHGETDYTENRRYCGQEDISLNQKGLAQAEFLRLKLKDLKIDKIYSSDLRRALQTASIVFEKQVILKRKALREIDFGRFSGMTFETASRIYPNAHKNWLSDPACTKIPGGESVAAFKKRVTRCFDSIRRENSKKTVAIVSHGGTIRIILLKLLKHGLDKFWNIEENCASVNIVKFKNDKPEKIWVNLPL